MKRSTTNKWTRWSLVFAINILIGLGVNAQNINEKINESRSVSISSLDGGKVKIKIVTKKGDDQQIFEKTYPNREAMKDDPELKDLGVDADDMGFGTSSFNFGSGGNTIHLNRNFGSSFGDDDDDNSFIFNFGGFDMDSLHTQMQSHFKSFGKNGFMFNFDDHGFDLDSLRNRFKFGGEDGSFWMNGEEFDDMESLREALKERFDDLDFDFDDWGNNGRSFSFNFGGEDEGDDNGFRVISRAKVFIRSARESDKEKVGADKMDELEIRDISFYPNPSDGRFTVDIKTGNSNPLQLKVVDPDGTVVYDKNDQSADGEYSFRVDLSGEQKGIYLLQVIQNNSSLTKRIIIE